MFADTDAIRALGAANSTQADDLAAIAAALSSMPGPDAASLLGPVGTRFLAALADATTEVSRAVAMLGERLAAGCRTAHASAAAYEKADEQTGALVATVF
jgi:nicotinamide mononucleotide (NMN) deamidase PncC